MFFKRKSRKSMEMWRFRAARVGRCALVWGRVGPPSGGHGVSAPAGGLVQRDAPPIVVVAKSAKLRFRLRRKLRPLPCSSSPHRAGRGGGPFRSWPKRKRAVHGPKEKAAWARSGAVALRARRGSAYRCLLRFCLAFGHAILFCEVAAAVPWRMVRRASGWLTHCLCFSFRCRWLGG